MEKSKENAAIDEMVKRKGVSPLNQKRLWARTTLIKRLLIKAGLTTHEEFDAEVDAMVRDIDQKIKEGLEKQLGMREE